jgi:hypothetical protein
LQKKGLKGLGTKQFSDQAAVFSGKAQRDGGDLEDSLRGGFACRVLLQRDIARVYEGWMKAVEFADGGVLSMVVGTDYTSHCGHHRLHECQHYLAARCTTMSYDARLFVGEQSVFSILYKRIKKLL